eukprot:scaffold13034_cov54-Phaeocystis_antarctica.AAC.5
MQTALAPTQDPARYDNDELKAQASNHSHKDSLTAYTAIKMQPEHTSSLLHRAVLVARPEPGGEPHTSAEAPPVLGQSGTDPEARSHRGIGTASILTSIARAWCSWRHRRAATGTR